MRSFTCDVCGRLLIFENSECVTCGTPQGFDAGARRLVPVRPDGGAGGWNGTGRGNGTGRVGAVRCANAAIAGCNWLADAAGGLCLCCRLTRTRPNDSDTEGLVAFARTEAAKRRLVFQLLELGLPVIPRSEDPRRGLAFDLLSSAYQPVVTGHADGVVTIDLAEGHDVHREAMRIEMAEPYRTLLGHVRHEVGHYYWTVLVQGNGLAPVPDRAVERFRECFGDERADYGQALRRHYASGPPAGWSEGHVSSYATAHPWEDWAETFAHYLHIRDTLQTAGAYGMVVTGPDLDVADAGDLVALPNEHVPADVPVERIVDTWLPLSYAINAVNRSMGKEDLYPFLLSPTVIGKLAFVHDLCRIAVSRVP